MALFPLIELPQTTGTKGQRMPLFREVAWDFKENRPIWRGGEPVYITGGPAVLVWAWNALHNPRGLHDVFTRDYGLGIQELEGKPYSEEIRRSEAIRYVRQALEVNPYIVQVDAIAVDFSGSVLSLTCQLQTIYGEVEINGWTL